MAFEALAQRGHQIDRTCPWDGSKLPEAHVKLRFDVGIQIHKQDLLAAKRTQAAARTS